MKIVKTEKNIEVYLQGKLQGKIEKIGNGNGNGFQYKPVSKDCFVPEPCKTIAEVLTQLTVA